MTSPDPRAALADAIESLPLYSGHDLNSGLYRIDQPPETASRNHEVALIRSETRDRIVTFLRSPSPYSGAAGEAVAWQQEVERKLSDLLDASHSGAGYSEARKAFLEAVYARPAPLPRDAIRQRQSHRCGRQRLHVPPPFHPVTRGVKRDDSWVLDTARELRRVLISKYRYGVRWRNWHANEIVNAIDGFLFIRPIPSDPYPTSVMPKDPK